MRTFSQWKLEAAEKLRERKVPEREVRAFLMSYDVYNALKLIRLIMDKYGEIESVTPTEEEIELWITMQYRSRKGT